MKNIIPFIFAAFLLGACNNGRKEKTEQKAGGEHGNHEMPATTGYGYADSINDGLIAQDTLKGSPARTAMATIGKTHIHISYHSPGTKGRVIWGGLVPYNAVWVTGAHTATSVNINNPVTIGAKKIEAGTYAVFTIPGEKEWIFILNKNYRQHLADNYTETEDLVRVPVQPKEYKMTQRLTYSVTRETDSSGYINIMWDKTKIAVPVTVAD